VADANAELQMAENPLLYYSTRSLCPVCGELVPGRVVPKEDRVFLERTCPEHGFFEGLICSDRAWYERLPLFFTEGIKPRHPLPREGNGKKCPENCGLCAAHTQIAGTAAIEISNVCNGACPACLANNRHTFELSVAEVLEAVEAVLRNQDHIDTLTLSGGEPTIHPQLFEILRVLRRPEIGRVAINSNGIRIARDEEFVRRLAAEENIYVSLHYDGSGARALRGIDPAVQEQATERLDRHGVAMAPVVLAAKGVNDHELGTIAEQLLLNYPTVKSIIFSIMAYTGSRGTGFPADHRTRLTIPEALERMEAGTGGRIKKRDFMPLPMPNPMCAAIGYYLLLDNELTPLIPFGEIEQVVAHTKNGHFGKVTPEFTQFLRDSIDAIYADPQQYPDGQRAFGAFRKFLDLLFPQGRPLSDQERTQVAEKHIRAVYLMQFMDRWTFDARRLSRCSCQHVLPGGKIVPSCGYYSYHRRFDPRFQAAGDLEPV
jgi:7,8-dihydro-6-hydroxymethylpterin dimethyltransferase